MVPRDANQDAKCYITTKQLTLLDIFTFYFCASAWHEAEADDGDCRCDKKCRDLPKAVSYTPYGWPHVNGQSCTYSNQLSL